MAVTESPYLVALSILIATFASSAALDLGGHGTAARGRARRMWLTAAAVTIGGGIWSTHFIAMLASVMPIAVSYDIRLTVLSLAEAVLLVGAGFHIISRENGSTSRVVFGAIFMGLGIASLLADLRAEGGAAMGQEGTPPYVAP